MKIRRKSLMIRRDTGGKGPFHVGYWDYPTPTQRRQPIFRSFGCDEDEEKAKELAETIAKQRAAEFIWNQ